MQNSFSIFLSLLVFSIVIVVHELGHYISARIFGVTVHEFAVGIGPAIFKHKSKKTGTIFSLRIIPFGGFNKLEGEDEDSNDVSHSFLHKAPWKRLIILLSGSIANIILGYLIFVFIISTSVTVSVPKIDQVMTDYPVHQGGLLPGDQIIRINNHKINTINDVQYYLSQSKNHDTTTDFIIKRQNETLTKSLKPIYIEKESRYVFGIIYSREQSNLWSGMKYGFYDTVLISKSIFDFLGRLLTWRMGDIQVTGPIGVIAKISETSQDRSNGLLGVLFLAGQIIIGVGTMNLMPIPALDGGKILFILVEIIRRKKISIDRESYIHFIGFVILVTLMIIITVFDVLRLRT